MPLTLEHTDSPPYGMKAFQPSDSPQPAPQKTRNPEHIHVLVLLAKKGDQSALERLIKTFEAPVYRLCYRIVCNPDQAEDARQETFIRMIKSIGSYNENNRFTNWLFSIATHVSIDLSRKNGRPLPEPEAGSDEDSHDLLQSCIQKEDIARLDRGMEKLPPRMRAVLALRFQEELTPVQISRVLDISPNQVRVELYRARLALRRVLGEDLPNRGGETSEVKP